MVWLLHLAWKYCFMMLHFLFLPLDLRKLEERKQEMSEKIRSYHVLRAQILKKMRDRDPLFKVSMADKRLIELVVFFKWKNMKNGLQVTWKGAIFLVRFPCGISMDFHGFP